MSSYKKLIIWDLPDQCFTDKDEGIAWGGSNEFINEKITPIGLIIKKYEDAARKNFLNLTEQYGLLKINGTTFAEQLELSQGLSYWWMTLVMQKCNFAKSPRIEEVVKLLSLDLYCKDLNITCIEVRTNNQLLIGMLNSLCKSRGIKFFPLRYLDKFSIKFDKSNYRSLIKNLLPDPLIALVWYFYHIVHRWKIRGVGVSNWRDSEGSIVFFSYLNNLPNDSRFLSHSHNIYWGPLPKEVNSLKIKSRWLHIWVPDKKISNSKSAIQVIEKFNTSNSNEQTHIILEAFLSKKIVLQVLLSWIKYMFKYLKARSSLSKLCHDEINFWPILKYEFDKSFFSVEILRNLLNTRLLNEAVKGLNHQSKGFYLQENQPWEFGLISSWRNGGHNLLFGVPHTTIRFWDLRYFHSFEAYYSDNMYRLPMPSYMLINGSAESGEMLNAGYPSVKLMHVEALRYLYLNEFRRYRYTKNSDNKCKILLLGDYSHSSTHNMLKVVNKALINKNTEIIFKPHPYCLIYNHEYPELDFINSSDNISSLCEYVDIVCAANMTTAVLDAYYCGAKIIAILNAGKLDLSPIKTSHNVKFVSNSYEFNNALEELRDLSLTPDYFNNYFDTNSEIPRWKKLLSS